MITSAIPIGKMPVDYINEGTKSMNDLLSKVRAHALEQQKLQELMRQHNQNYGLAKGAAGRAERALGMQSQHYADLHKKFLQDSDPKHKFNQIKMLMDYLAGMEDGGQKQNQEPGLASTIPNIGNLSPGMDNENQKPGSGELESFISSLPPEQQQSVLPMIGKLIQSQQQGFGGTTTGSVSEPEMMRPKKAPMNMEYIKKAMMYKTLGLPIPSEASSETPEQKDERAFNQFERKEKYKAEHPHASSSGITPEDRQADREIRLATLKEKIRAAKEREKHADPEEKLALKHDILDMETAAKNQQEINKVSAHKGEAESKEEGKIFGEMQSEVVKGYAGQDTLNELKNAFKSPAAKDVLSHPYLHKYTIDYFKRNGNTEQKKFAGSLESLSGKLIGEMAKQISSKATNADLALATASKISGGDSLESAKQKMGNIETLYELNKQRKSKALEIHRYNKGLSPVEAMDLADKEIDGDKIRAKIDTESIGTTKMIAPNGTEHDVPNEDVSHAPNGWRVK